MRTNSIILILLFSLIIFFSFIVLRSNQLEVSLDLLFYEVKVKIGFLTLIAYLSGLVSCLVLEAIYFFKKNKN